MVKNLPEVTVQTFPKLLEEIEKYQQGTSATWYRGCRSNKFKLLPTLFRHPIKKDIESVLKLEKKITTRFVQRSIPFIERGLSGPWDKMFFMQHYGVPTRLLDWTENPFIAAFFAIENNLKHEKNDAIIWMLDPVTWNKSALRHISYNRGILDETDPLVNNHEPGSDTDEMPDYVLMMYGSYNSTRIVAQRGVFSIFGKSATAMEDFYKRGEYDDGCLKRLRIPATKVPEIRDSLYRKGITESVVFPEVSGLAREIKREHGFG